MRKLLQHWPKRLAQSFGLAVLIAFESYSDLTNPAHLLMYHAYASTANVALPPLILLALMTAAGFLLLQLTWRTPFWLWTCMLFAGGVAVGVFQIRHILISSLGGLQARFHSIPLLVGLYHALEWLLPLFVLAACLGLWKFRRLIAAPARMARSVVNVLLIGAAVFGLFNIWQIGEYLFYRPMPRAPLLPYRATSNGAPRVVWIVFDELAYGQLYESRFRGLELPNFDKLRAQSDVYSNVVSIGTETEKVLPSLITGNVYTDLVFSEGRPLAKIGDSSDWETVTAANSIFGTAEQYGWNSAVSGWFNPYCRTYSTVLQQCFRSAKQMWANKMLLGESVGANLWLETRYLFSNFEANEDVAKHREDAEAILSHATKMVADPRNDFIFIHLPEPHPPSSFNRHTGEMIDKPGRSYADGLAYADQVLGELMVALQASPRWKDTTLVVNGDHTWRTYSWKKTPLWTAEDSEMVRGHEGDMRPALIVHSAGQTEGQVVDSRISLMASHDMVQEMIERHPKNGFTGAKLPLGPPPS